MRNCLCPPCCSVSVQLTEPPNKPFSLPSKVHRLLRDGVWGADGERRPPTVVRLGNTERALPAALVAHVDAIVVRWEGCGGVPSVCVCAGGQGRACGVGAVPLLSNPPLTLRGAACSSEALIGYEAASLLPSDALYAPLLSALLKTAYP